MIHTRLREWHPDLGLCSLDPVSLTGLALGAAGGGLASILGGGSSKPPAPVEPQAPPPPQQQPVGDNKQQAKAQPSTFLGSVPTPQPTQSGQKTLLGQ